MPETIADKTRAVGRGHIWQPMHQFHDLAPAIDRQRLVIDGYPKARIVDDDIKRFLSQLSDELGMKELIEPVTHRSDTYGFAHLLFGSPLAGFRRAGPAPHASLSSSGAGGQVGYGLFAGAS